MLGIKCCCLYYSNERTFDLSKKQNTTNSKTNLTNQQKTITKTITTVQQLKRRHDKNAKYAQREGESNKKIQKVKNTFKYTL